MPRGSGTLGGLGTQGSLAQAHRLLHTADSADAIDSDSD